MYVHTSSGEPILVYFHNLNQLDEVCFAFPCLPKGSNKTQCALNVENDIQTAKPEQASVHKKKDRQKDRKEDRKKKENAQSLPT